MALPGNIRDREYNKFGLNSKDETAVRTINENQSGTIISDVEHDSISVSYPNTSTEIYAFYLGGLGGTLQATVTVVYTDDTKEFIATVVRS